MKWEDLEPGDVVEFNPNFVAELYALKFPDRSAGRYNIYKNELDDLINVIRQQKEFIIESIQSKGRIEIVLKDINWCFYLDEDGFSCYIPKNMNNRIFNIVKLKEEQNGIKV